jgi:hypothetical protein
MTVLEGKRRHARVAPARTRRRAIGNQNPRQGYYYRKHPIQVLLLRANDLRFGSRSADLLFAVREPVNHSRLFNPSKGYGFVQPNVGGENILVHISEIVAGSGPGLADCITWLIVADEVRKARPAGLAAAVI